MVDMLYNTNRTCSIHVGIGSSIDNNFEIMDYSWKVVHTYTDKNYTFYNPGHPQMDNVVFYDRYV